jgi:peptidoglycan/LPS O-acetylase OafA/YrhL
VSRIKTLRVQELDALRLLAALSVVGFHYGINFHFWPSAEGALKYGFLGVELFFMISGFVILQTATRKSAYEFMCSRFARLYPTFWCVLLLTWPMRGGGTPIQALANATMAARLLHQPVFDPVYWTLVIELKFYILILALISLRQIQRIELWLIAWLGACVASLVTGHFRALTFDLYAPYFTAGCVLYLIYVQGLTLTRALTISACLVLAFTDAKIVADKYDGIVVSYVTVKLIVSALFVVFLSVAMRWIKLPNWKVWSSLGLLTYPIYLVHSVPGFTVWSWLPKTMSPQLRTLCVCAFVFSVSGLLAATIERKGCSMLYSALVRIPDRIIAWIRGPVAPPTQKAPLVEP